MSVLFVLSGLLGVLGFWFGEGGSLFWQTLPVIAGAIGCLLVTFVSPGRLWRKVLAGGVSLLLYVAAFSLGSLSFDSAFSECLTKGEEVRGRLSEYQRVNGRYPERLAQLHGPTPCGRVLRPTILEYQRAQDGYVLTFRDWLVEHTATESAPFMAHK